jgi:translocation and assembly module TamB
MRDDPTMRLSATADTVRIGTVRIPRLDARTAYASRRLNGELRLLRDAQPAINMTASLPIDLALAGAEKRLVDDSLRVSVRADSVDLALLEAMVPDVVNAHGRLQAHFDVKGKWTRPTFAGAVAVRDAEMGLVKAGIHLRGINGHLSLSGDSVPVIALDSLVMASGPQGDSRAFLAGTVRFSERPERACESGTASIADCLAQRSAFDIRFRADNFEAIRQRRLADLEIGGNLQLAGTYRESMLTGGLRVERGAIYLRERLRKQIVDVDQLTDEEVGAFIDTSFGGPSPRPRPTWMTGIVNNMSVNNVDIAIGEDVWLRSQEASIKLGGSVSVTRQGNRLVLEGPLLANRGTYRLYLAPGVIRTFEVQRGVITFFGGPVIDPALDIVALHTVRQAGSDRRDVRIRVTIGGTLSQPRLALSSDERIQISETQILSYLVSGQPTFVAENTGQLQTAFATILPTLGALFERAIVEQLQFLDMFQLQTATRTLNREFFQQGLGGPLEILAQSRIAFGKQLTERTFLSANAGLCSIGGQDAQNHRFLDAFGLTLEHRLNHGFSLQMSVEPATSAALCRTDAVEFNRPRQFGLDLFREWSF